MKYQNKKNGRIANVSSPDPKYSTVMLEYDDGTTQSITTSTLKRWWRKLEDEVPTEVPVTAPKKAVSKKTASVSKEAKDFTEEIDFVDEQAKAHGLTITPADRFYVIRCYQAEDKRAASIVLKQFKDRLELHTKARFLSDELSEQLVPVNHCFNRKFKFTMLDSSTRNIINSIIKFNAAPKKGDK